MKRGAAPSSVPHLVWYVRRLAAMSPAEMGWRAEARLRQEVWARRQLAVPKHARPRWPPADSRLPPVAERSALPERARRAVVVAADEILAGRARVLGALREDMAAPDWSLDPRSGRGYPSEQVAFRIDLHAHDDPRDVKQVWELSRHHHLTVLACAWWATGDERYASAVARQLCSWWTENPVLRGVNWASGIELGIRLISWVWIRRLLGEWPEATTLFEHNDVAVRQIYWHQRYLATFASRGSSANNHAIAEAAGLLAASCAFPWFAESRRWSCSARRRLERELRRNTFRDGLDREQALEYHRLVAELVLCAGAEAEAAGRGPGTATWTLLCRMMDAAAAVLDCSGRPPRQGDGDDGRGLDLGAQDADRWLSLLSAGEAVLGRRSWWPSTPADARSVLLSGLAGGAAEVVGRPPSRPSHFRDAGLTLLRTSVVAGEEIWCRCDGGPHGFLSIAAHAHADALSVELRHDGVEIWVDPGTYCYQGEPTWRGYFRSTLAHNTVELDGRDQSQSGGPFLWVRHARSEVLEISPEVEPARWMAEHRGYDRRGGRASHRRTVVLDAVKRSVTVADLVRANRTGRRVRLAFHLGPSVEADLEGTHARLRWEGPSGHEVRATMRLSESLQWRAHRGELDPPLGWYSPAFGRKEPTTTLVGSGSVRMTEAVFRTELHLQTAPVGVSEWTTAVTGASTS